MCSTPSVRTSRTSTVRKYINYHMPSPESSCLPRRFANVSSPAITIRITSSKLEKIALPPRAAQTKIPDRTRDPRSATNAKAQRKTAAGGEVRVSSSCSTVTNKVRLEVESAACTRSSDVPSAPGVGYTFISPLALCARRAHRCAWLVAHCKVFVAGGASGRPYRNPIAWESTQRNVVCSRTRRRRRGRREGSCGGTLPRESCGPPPFACHTWRV